MDKPILGCLVKSKKGHDTGRIYLVTAEVNHDFVLITDGKFKKIENPKLKRIKHLAVLCGTDLNKNVTDKEVRDTIAEFITKQGGYNA